MAEAVGSIDCPDCQFQLLQQQSQASGTEVPDNHQVQQPGDLLQINQNPSETTSMWTDIRTKPSSSLSQGIMTSHYQLRHSIGNGLRMASSSSSNCLNVYSYNGEAENFHITPGRSSTPGSLQNTSGGMSSVPQLGDMTQPPVPIEPCDYNGYCTTCAVLDLPTNDKYYRPSNSRPHVFPPIFHYAQGASSVIPCFSPIPDCPWGNEYNGLYGYTTSYSQQTSNPPLPNDYYGSSNVISNSSSTVLSTESSNIPNQVPANTIPYTTPTPFSATTRNECDIGSRAKAIESSQMPPKPTHESSLTPECLSRSVPAISNQSTCSSEEDDSSSVSDGSESILSEDRELISVVEDDDNDTTKELSESFNPDRSNSKCWVCRNPLGMAAACSSPQLENILEHMGTEITAEDLDLSVSSGDIEIGGIDDEIKDFQHKKDFPSSQLDISISKLSLLVGIPLQHLSGFEPSSNHEMPDSDLVCLCFKCGKLVALTDALERQLTTAASKLHHHLLVNHPTKNIPPFDRHFRVSRDGAPYALNPKRRCENIDKSTQIDKPINLNPNINIIDRSESRNHNFYNDVLKTANPTTFNPPQIVSATVPVLEVQSPLKDDDSTDFGPSDKDTGLLIPPMSLISTDLHVASKSNNTSQNPQDFTDCLAYAKHSTNISNTNLCESHDATELNKSYTFINSTKAVKPVSIDANIECRNAASEEAPNSVPNACKSIVTGTNDEISRDRASINDTGKAEFHKSTMFLKDTTCVPKPEPKKIRNILITCNYCQRNFSTKSNLKAHDDICKFKTSHRPVEESQADSKKNMTCSNCGIGFRSLIRRKMHLERGCKAIVFNCEFCSKRFSKNSELKVHLLLHQGEKSFKCNVCDASFSTKGNQIAHTRTHSKEKAYPCTLCEKGFNRKYALLMHMNRHAGTKPFVCSVCKKRFSDPSNLKNHMNRSHRDHETICKEVLQSE